MAPAVQGSLTVDEALRQVLAGSGLEAVAQGETLVVRQSPAPPGQEAMTLPAVQVTADVERSYRVSSTSTATRTDTPILETPFAVQVVPQELLRDQQVVRLEDALNNVSGVSYLGSAAGREASFSLRGFGDQFGNSAPILYDGYRLYGIFQAIPDIALLQQVEVLKGPSSILFGQIEPGGVINLVSKQPLAHPFYEAELQVGSREFVRPRLDVTGPLTVQGNLLYRFNAVYEHASSFRDYDTDTNHWAVAPAFTWKMGPRTELTLNLQYIYNRGPADFGLTQFGTGVVPVSRGFVTNNPDDAITTDYLSVGYSVEHRFSDHWKLRQGFRYISYDYDYSVVALPFVVADNHALIARFFADQDGKDRSYTLSTGVIGTFVTAFIKHTLTAGLDLNRSESRIVTVVDFDNPSILDIFNPDYTLVPKPSRETLALFGDTRDSSDRLGVYLQDQMYLLHNLILVAGLRYDSVERKTTNVDTPSTPGGQSEQTDDAVTPRVGLLYRPVKELGLFANYSQSFAPNTAVTASGASLAPQRGEGFEVGLKAELLEQKLLATLTYFDITKTNIAVADSNNPLFSIAVGEQRNQGVELDIAGEIVPGWKIIGSYAYIDAAITEDTNAAIVGNRPISVPEHKVTLWTTYEIQQGLGKGLGFGGGMEYASNRFGDLANSFRIGDYLLGNAAIFYRRHNYRLAMNVRNLSNASYIKGTTGNEGGIEVGEPFTVLGSISITY